MQAQDWAFCRESLRRHSRTFAVPIGMLPGQLEHAITCSYLLCRIADTIEDTPDWATADKQRLYRSLLDALDGSAEPSRFAQQVEAVPGGDPAERELLIGLPTVMRVFARLPEGLRRPCQDGVAELVGGMMIFSRRPAGNDGYRCLHNESDLERYCYFVAGVIGRLLTETFLHAHPQTPPHSQRLMRQNAERFGAGLQLVNILRDLSCDLQRSVCFVPRTLLDEAGLEPAQLCEPSQRAAVTALLGDLFERARAHLDAAFDYTLAIPSSASAIRRFCLVPLWLAVSTLELCRTSPDLLDPERTVKLSRHRVVELINECVQAAADDDSLRRLYAMLDATSPEQAA